MKSKKGQLVDRIVKALGNRNNVSSTSDAVTIQADGVSVRIVSKVYFNLEITFPVEETISQQSLIVRHFCAVTLYYVGEYTTSFLNTGLMAEMLTRPLECWHVSDSDDIILLFITNMAKLADNDIEYMFMFIARYDSSFALYLSAKAVVCDVYDAIALIQCDPYRMVTEMSKYGDSLSIGKVSCYFGPSWRENCYYNVIMLYVYSLIG